MCKTFNSVAQKAITEMLRLTTFGVEARARTSSKPCGNKALSDLDKEGRLHIADIQRWATPEVPYDSDAVPGPPQVRLLRRKTVSPATLLMLDKN